MQNGQPIPIVPPAQSDFQEIQDTVFTPICTQCHIGASAPHGLRLDAANSYALLVNVASDEVPTLQARESRQSRPELHRAEDRRQRRGRRAHAARPGAAAAGSHRPHSQLDRRRRAARRAAPDNLIGVQQHPGRGRSRAAGLDKLTVIFAGDVDAALAASGTFELRDGLDQPVPVAQARGAGGPAERGRADAGAGLAAGSYQLTVHGEGPVALADTAGHVLDGDADGKAGGDFLMSFDVSAGAPR